LKNGSYLGFVRFWLNFKWKVIFQPDGYNSNMMICIKTKPNFFIYHYKATRTKVACHVTYHVGKYVVKSLSQNLILLNHSYQHIYNSNVLIISDVPYNDNKGSYFGLNPEFASAPAAVPVSVTH